MSDVKPLAKSLHTVSVLVQVALYVLQSNGATSNKAAIDNACVILGLSDKPDVYDLKGAALKQLNKNGVVYLPNQPPVLYIGIV